MWQRLFPCVFNSQSEQFTMCIMHVSQEKGLDISLTFMNYAIIDSLALQKHLYILLVCSISLFNIKVLCFRIHAIQQF